MTREFEIARMLIIRGFRDGEIDEPRVFAWVSRIYPLIPRELDDQFADDFHVSADKVRAVLGEIDTVWRSGNTIDFYSLESRHGSGTQTNLDRMGLINFCRLAFLDNRFSQNIWNDLVKPGSGPVESQGIAGTFGPADIYY